MNKKIVIGIVVIAIMAGGAWMLTRNNYSSNYSSSDQSSGYPEAGAPAPSAPAQAQAAPPDQQTGQPSPAPAPLPAAAATSEPRPDERAAAVKEFTVTAQDYSFTPSALAVKKGDTVKITFRNVDGTHDFRIAEFNVASKRVRTGEQDTVTFVADKTGSFEFYCSVGSHRLMGMKGTLTVTE